MAERYYFGQGRVFIMPYGSAGLDHRWLGDVSAFSVGFEVENLEHFESYSGQRGLARRIPIQTDMTANLTLHQMDADNLGLALRGTVTAIPAVTTPNATFNIPTGAVAGDFFVLPHLAISATNFSVRDSKTSPTTLTPTTHYTIDLASGVITIVAIPTGTVFPLVVSYEYGAQKQVAMLTTAAPSLSLVYAGLNLAESNAASRVELYRLDVNPLEELQVINTDAFGNMTISMAAVADTSKPLGGVLGQYGRILEPG
jgi:hypothetical protein